MSLNVGGIYVRVKPRLTAARVRAAITEYWTSRGAKPAARLEPTKPLELERTKQLAFAVMAPSDGYICIADSERYNADFALANFLATKLATQVIWYSLYGATDAGALRILGPGRKPKGPDDTYGDVEKFVSERLPHGFVYFDKLGDPDPLAFKNVDASAYDRGPIPGDEDEPAGDPPPPPAPTFADDPDAWPVRVPRALVDAGELRFGYLVAFFLPGVFRKHCASVEKVLDLWLSIVPPDAHRWSRIGANATESRAFSPRTIDQCRAQLTPKVAAKHSFFEVYGPESDAAQYHFKVRGSATDASHVKRGTASSVIAYLPSTTPPERVARFADGVAELLAYTTGLVSPALQFDNHDSRAQGRAAAGRIATRYAGVELQVDGFKLGKTMHGAHWLTFLGPDLIKALGGRTKIDKARNIHAIADAGHGVCLRASATPDASDLFAGPPSSGLCAIARLVEPLRSEVPKGSRAAGPLQSPQLDDGVGSDCEALAEELRPLWHRRLLDDSPRLREIAAQLDQLTRLEATELSALDIASLASVPYLSKQLGEQLLLLLRRLVETNQTAAAERIAERFSATTLLGMLRYDDRIERLLSFDTPLFPWLLARATGAERARVVASVGATLVVKNPSLAPEIVVAMPADADQSSWDILLRPLNDHLGALFNAKTFVTAARLSDDIQRIAKHHPPIYLWTASIYIACGRIDDAMSQIERMFEAGHRDWKRVRGDEDFAPLFKNPRFLALKPVSSGGTESR